MGLKFLGYKGYSRGYITQPVTLAITRKVGVNFFESFFCIGWISALFYRDLEFGRGEHQQNRSEHLPENRVAIPCQSLTQPRSLSTLAYRLSIPACDTLPDCKSTLHLQRKKIAWSYCPPVLESEHSISYIVLDLKTSYLSNLALSQWC